MILAIVVYIFILAILLRLAWIDFKHYLLPNVWVGALGGCAFVFHLLTNWAFVSPIHALLGLLFGGGLLLFIRIVAEKLLGLEDALGMGDVKFMGACGLLLGVEGVMLSLIIGSFLGGLHGVLLQHYLKRTQGHAPQLGQVNVPAGVGLAGGVIAILCFDFGLWWTHL